MLCGELLEGETSQNNMIMGDIVDVWKHEILQGTKSERDAADGDGSITTGGEGLGGGSDKL